jgi:peptidoglycan hydrolase-like protein with peptidoglycan-binding domain
MLVRDPVEEAADAPPLRRRRRLVWAALGLALLAAAGFVLVAVREDPAAPPSTDGAGATATATVERRTLVERENVDGTLGYAGTRSVVHRDGTGSAGSGSAGSGSGSAGSGSGTVGSGSGTGTVTWLAASGSVVRPGGVLYRVDDQPVVLMDGSVPAYRRLAPGVAPGPDVRQLERNLAGLGFGAGVAVDDRFTAATALAVRRWQRSLGLKRTGAVELGRVVFLSGKRRVGERKAAIGTTVADGTEVLAATSTRRVVEVELEVSKQSLVRRGAGVRVMLPDGGEVSGRIASVGRAARSKGGGGAGAEGGGEDEEPVIDLTITLRSARGTRGLDRAPVTVGIAGRVERDVLSVPVTALLAQRGGRYAVEIVQRGGVRRLVPVETGFFADGYVEVTGRGLRPGMRVAVPE